MTGTSGVTRIALHAALLLVLLAWSAAAAGQQPLPTPPAVQLQLAGETSLVVDPACNATAGAKLPLTLRGPGPGAAAIPLALRAEHLSADATGAVSGITVTIEPAAGGALPKTLAPGDSLRIMVVAKGFLAPGTWKTNLFNDQTALGSARFIVADPLAHLRLDVPDPSHPAITLTRNTTTSLLLRNDDGLPADVSWEYRLKDAPPGEAAIASGKLAIPASDAAVLTVTPPNAWFAGASTFHDAAADGYLQVQLQPGSGCTTAPQAPTKLFTVGTTLVGYSPAEKAGCTYTATFALLLLGAFCSLYVNYKIPDERVRRALRQRLQDLGTAVERLPSQLASRLRVVVSVERRALTEKLGALVWWSTDFEQTRQCIVDSLTRLEARVEVLARMGSLRVRYEAMPAVQLPPSLLDRFETLFEETVLQLAVLEPTDARVRAAVANLDDIEASLGRWAQPELAPPQDLPLATQIVARSVSLYGDLQPGGALDAQRWKDLVAQIPGLEGLATKPVAATDLDPVEYVRRDWVAVIGSLLRRYYRVLDQRKPADDDPIVKRQGELVGMLRKRTDVSLLAARRLVAEMTAGVYAPDVEKEIRENRVAISLENDPLRQFEPGWFGIAFHNADYAATDARQELVPEWNFGHVATGYDDKPENYLTENGWSLAHYFPGAKVYDVTVTFRRADGNAIQPPLQLKRQIAVAEVAGRREARRKGSVRAAFRWIARDGSEAVGLGVALGGAILALAAGAKDQLLKMGPFFGLIAVFLLGFGSDQIKSLLSKK